MRAGIPDIEVQPYLALCESFLEVKLELPNGFLKHRVFKLNPLNHKQKGKETYHPLFYFEKHFDTYHHHIARSI